MCVCIHIYFYICVHTHIPHGFLKFKENNNEEETLVTEREMFGHIKVSLVRTSLRTEMWVPRADATGVSVQGWGLQQGWRKTQCRYFRKPDFKVMKKAWKVLACRSWRSARRGLSLFSRWVLLPCWIELIGCYFIFLACFQKLFSLEYQNRLYQLELILVSKVRTLCQCFQCGANRSMLKSTDLKYHIYNTLKSHEYLHLFLKSILYHSYCRLVHLL